MAVLRASPVGFDRLFRSFDPDGGMPLKTTSLSELPCKNQPFIELVDTDRACQHGHHTKSQPRQNDRSMNIFQPKIDFLPSLSIRLQRTKVAGLAMDVQDAITPVSKLGDRAAPNDALTRHQAVLPITVFGRRINDNGVTVGLTLVVCLPVCATILVECPRHLVPTAIDKIGGMRPGFLA